VSIVIPAFNEAQNLALLINELRQKLEDNLDFEIIVVDDGSQDGTYMIAGELGVQVIRHKKNEGYFESIRSGVAKAIFPIIVVFDARGIYDPRTIILGIDTLKQAKADLAIAYPVGMTASYQIGSRLLAIVQQLLVSAKFKDPFSTFFCLRRDILKSIRVPLIPSGFAALPLALFFNAFDENARIVEFPVKIRRRQSGREIRRYSLRDGFRLFRVLTWLSTKEIN
jgi:glycosyltransferase involved in cell wall biosynthesis